jgi:hypothetical protein
MTLTFVYELPKVLLLLEKTSDSRRSWSCVLLCDIVVWALGFASGASASSLLLTKEMSWLSVQITIYIRRIIPGAKRGIPR